MWRIDPAGDQALLVRLGNAIDPLVLGHVLALERALGEAAPTGLLGTVPSYASLLCRYDPRATNYAQLSATIQRFEAALRPVASSGDVVDVPTRYDGPDLAEVAEKTKLTPEQVVELHSGREYLVFCVGFAPGFTYCGELDERLDLPRKPSPRVRVSAGSVGIAGRQTGIYAVDSPGGWNLVGRTALTLFDVRATPPARFKAGDRLRFVPINA